MTASADARTASTPSAWAAVRTGIGVGVAVLGVYLLAYLVFGTAEYRLHD